jgi:hypothetical protein
MRNIMEGGDEVAIDYDEKHGKILLHGMDSETVRKVAKQLKNIKNVTIQLFPDGFVISEDGIFLSKADGERPTGYA